MANLTPQTTYRVRAYAINSFGISYGNTVDLLTGASGPTGLKSFNGLAVGSVKTINGLAIGSVKAWN